MQGDKSERDLESGTGLSRCVSKLHDGHVALKVILEAHFP